MRPGRARSKSKRERNGQPQRPAIDRAAVAASMPHRRGLPPTLQVDPLAVGPFGRLRLLGQITATQYEAGRRYARIVTRYRTLIDAPNGSPPSLAGRVVGGSGGGGGEMADDDAGRIRSDYKQAYVALERGAGLRGARAVAHWACWDKDDYPLCVLKPGLNVLVRHFGL